MVQFVFLGGLMLGVFLAPVRCELMSVCVEEDEDLRVDCHIKLVPSRINSYEFSMTTGPKETLINTNISGSSVDPRFRDRSWVDQREPEGYRLTMTGYATKVPHNTTFMCKVDKNVASVYVEKEHLLLCSAVSLFLQSCQWTMFPLLSFCLTHIYSLAFH